MVTDAGPFFNRHVGDFLFNISLCCWLSLRMQNTEGQFDGYVHLKALGDIYTTERMTANV
jgi:hypothetical protein